MPETKETADYLNAIAYVKKYDEKELDFLFKLGSKNEPVVTDLGNGLLVSFLTEKEGKFEFIQNRQLQAAGITKTALFEIGLRNLKKITVKNFRLKPMKDIFAVFADGNFEASLILIPELWDRILKAHIRNNFIAAIPSRDILVFCDSESEKGIREIKALVKRIKSDGEKLLSDCLYIRINNFWEQFEQV